MILNIENHSFQIVLCVLIFSLSQLPGKIWVKRVRGVKFYNSLIHFLIAYASDFSISLSHFKIRNLLFIILISSVTHIIQFFNHCFHLIISMVVTSLFFLSNVLPCFLFIQWLSIFEVLSIFSFTVFFIVNGLHELFEDPIVV